MNDSWGRVGPRGFPLSAGPRHPMVGPALPGGSTPMNALSTARAAALLAMTACSSSHESDDPEPAPLRPGVEDSSKAYKGTPSPAENAFWEAIRSGDDAARAEAVTKLGADVAEDPSNGYSEFLVGASSFMPSSDVLR